MRLYPAAIRYGALHRRRLSWSSGGADHLRAGKDIIHGSVPYVLIVEEWGGKAIGSQEADVRV
jgi:hypothetical protein